MNRKQVSAWCRVILSLVLAWLFGSLTYLTLVTLPVTAQGNLDCDSEGTLPPPSPGTEVFTLTGTVNNQADGPVPCVQVFAFSGAIQFDAYTNSTGQFTFTLSAGAYDVVFNPPPGANLASRSVRGISQTQTLNTILPPGRAISGTVYSDVTMSTPVGNVAIYAFNENTFEGFGLPPSTMSGAYQIALEAGTWTLTFTPSPFLGLGPTTTTIILTEDITKDIILQPGFTVYGQVITEGGGGQANVEIFAQDPNQSDGYGFSPTNQAGLYTGTLPTGSFDISFLAPPFLDLGSIVITGVAGPPDVPLTVTLPAGYTVSGTVKCGSGLANSFVFASPEPPLLAGLFGGWGRFAGVDGRYALALPTGIYTFSVSPPGDTSLPQATIPGVVVDRDLTLDFDYCALILTKTVDQITPQPGQRITYTLTVSNSGLLTATDAAISDALSSGLTFAGPVTLDPPQPGATLAQGASDLPALASGLLITPGERITVTLPVTVNTILTPGLVVANTAAVTSARVITPQTGSSTITVTVVTTRTDIYLPIVLKQ